MQLLIDVGNSRIKWAYSQNGKLERHGAAVHQGHIPAEAVTAWLESPTPQCVVAANVAGSDYAKQLNAWVQQHWQLQVEFLKVDASILEPAYAEPERLGIDRWLVLVAAQQLSSGTVAVIDAGTALTLDIISAEGKHLGGIVIPGLELMSTSLQQKASGVDSSVEGNGIDPSDLLGKDTRSCIEKGSLYAVTGAIEHVFHRFGVPPEGEVFSVVICGGNAGQVMAELNSECKHVPDLVFQGMQIVKGGC